MTGWTASRSTGMDGLFAPSSITRHRWRSSSWGVRMVLVKRSRLLVLAAATCWIGWTATAHADWAACQRKPTRACLLEEALRGDGAPLAGKDRLDVLIFAGAVIHPEYLTAADIDEALRLAK